MYLEHEPLDLVAYSTGISSSIEVNKAIEGAWQTVLQNEKERRAIAEEFYINESELLRTLPTSPFQVRVGHGGIDWVDQAIITFGTAAAYDLAKKAARETLRKVATDLVEDALKEASKKILYLVWKKYVKPRAEAVLPLDGLGGQETEIDKDKSDSQSDK